jgi:hypothetical protein
MGFNKIEMSGRDTIEKIRKKYNHPLSSHAFSSLYLWQKEMGLSIACDDDFFVIRCGFKGENCFFFPCGDLKRKERFIREHMREKNFKLCYMNGADVEFINQYFHGCFDISYDRDSCEYIYDTAELIGMSGGKFAKIRTKLHHLEREHSLHTEILNAKNRGAAKEIIEAWAQNHEMRDGRPLDDIGVAFRAVNEADTLGLTGALVYVDGEPYAVTAGCGISEDSFDLCLAKQKSAVTGLDYYATIELCKIISSRFAYLNAEEDFGIKGLRIHKNDMRPVKLWEMWEGTPIV